jgi:thiamine kinase
MPPREAEHVARLAVPGTGVPHLKLLGSGLLNDTYRVDRDGRAYSMRVACASSQGSTLERAWELEVLQQAAQRGLAPPMVRGDAERGFLIQEWVEGHSWPASAVRRTRNIARMAALLKRVHELSVPEPARIMRPGAWVLHYGAKLAAASPSGAPAPALADGAEARLARLEALPQAAGVVCHSDVHLLNVLECPLQDCSTSPLLLLDWEYAHVSEPFWDLAGWGANNDFSDPLLRELLAAYLGRPPGDDEWTRCKLLVWLYDYVCLLWSSLYLNLRRGGVTDGVETRAGALSARLTGSLANRI